jgi:hypothetical protein
MRYFQSTPEFFDVFRDQIMDMLSLPSDGTEQPWVAGTTILPLASHEYTDPRFQPMIEQALVDGIVTELTEEQYQATLPPPTEDL